MTIAKKHTTKNITHEVADNAAAHVVVPEPESPAESTKAVLASLLAVLEAQGTIPKDTAAHLKGQL